MKTKFYSVLILLGLLVAMTASIYAKEFPFEDDKGKLLHEKKFSTKEGERLKVEGAGADVCVGVWDKNEVAIKTYGSENAESKFDFYYEKTDWGVKVVNKQKDSFLKRLFHWNSYYIRFEIMVPKVYNVEVYTSGGDVYLNSIRGENTVKTSGGDINVRQSIGEGSFKTSGGDIEVKDYTGSIEAETSGGDIQLQSKDGSINAATSGGDIDIKAINGKINASTSGGDISVIYDGENEGISCATTGGDIKIRIPETLKANVILSTTGGDVSCNVQTSKTVKISSSKLQVELNGGGKSIKCATTGGDIDLSKK